MDKKGAKELNLATLNWWGDYQVDDIGHSDDI